MSDHPAPQAMLALPPELSIYTVADLRAQWLAWLALDPGIDGTCTLAAAEVAEIDGAGLQLLLSLQVALAARGRRLGLQSPSPQLLAAWEGAGLDAQEVLA